MRRRARPSLVTGSGCNIGLHLPYHFPLRCTKTPLCWGDHFGGENKRLDLLPAYESFRAKSSKAFTESSSSFEKLSDNASRVST